MEKETEEYFSYLITDKNASTNTLSSYKHDIFEYLKYLENKKIPVIKAKQTDILDYVLSLQQKGKSNATISRNISSLKSLYKFLFNKKYIDSDPTFELHSFKSERTPPSMLTDAQVCILLDMPVLKDIKGYRDKAILELLYATGIRVSDLINLKVSDINLSVGYIYHRKNNKERVIPIYSIARESVRDYIEKRKEIVGAEKTDVLFLNLNGSPLSRQGIWKMVRYYCKKSGLKIDITPHSIRHSFALHLLEHGADLKSVSELLGYSNMSSAKIYEKILENKLSEVYQKAHPRAKS